MNFILEQISFYFSLTIILFFPGWFLMRAIFKKKYKQFENIETFVISFGLSIVAIDFLIILMGRIGVPFTRKNILITLGLFLFVCYLFFAKKMNGIMLKKIKLNLNRKIALFSNNLHLSTTGFFNKILPRNNTSDLHTNQTKSKNYTLTVILILFLTIFIKTIYLQNTIFPTSTDLGHHMYWAKKISTTGKLPNYEKIKIATSNNKDKLTAPQPISDFIIGEHLIFSAINLISGITFVSYFPTLVLLLINIMSVLALFILAFRLFSNSPGIAILTLLLVGPLWALSSPQAKFVSGGVIGNLLGNFFIPLCLYFYYRAFNEKKTEFLIAAFFLTTGLFYTHHLSGFIFLFIIAFILLFLSLFSLGKTIQDKNFPNLKPYSKIIISKGSMIFLFFALLFLLLIYTPSYLVNDATKIAVGTPSKSTRAGLSFAQFKYAIGEPRLALGILGTFIILGTIITKNKRDTLKYSILLGWAMSLTIMTLKPNWLHINLPSGRIANYANFPFIIISAFFLTWILNFFREKKYFYLPTNIVIIFLLVIFSFIFSAGFYDNSQSIVSKSNNQRALETFQAAKYINQHLNENDVVIKDHNYLKADSWIKLFFMKDYNIPLSRSYFKRYNDITKPREMCTLWMISEPTSNRAKRCYNNLNIKFIMLNPNIDSAQFEKGFFWKIYSGKNIAVYYNK